MSSKFIRRVVGVSGRFILRVVGVSCKFFHKVVGVSSKFIHRSSGLSLELSDREKFCVIFRILGRSFGPNFEFPYLLYTLKLLPQLIIGRSEPVKGDFFSQIALYPEQLLKPHWL